MHSLNRRHRTHCLPRYPQMSFFGGRHASRHPLTHTMLGINISKRHSEIFFLSVPRKSIFTFSPKQTICMNCKSLFSWRVGVRGGGGGGGGGGEGEGECYVINFSSAESAQMEVRENFIHVVIFVPLTHRICKFWILSPHSLIYVFIYCHQFPWANSECAYQSVRMRMLNRIYTPPFLP